MNRDYRFKIEESEMMEYYEYVFALTPKNKTRVVWIKGSIPVLIAFTLYFFHLYTNLWLDALGVVLGLIWIFLLSGKLYTKYIKGQVKAWFDKNVTKASFPEVHVSFKDEITVDKNKIPFSSLRRVLPLKHVLIFFYGENELFIIPNRVIGDHQQMKEFSEELTEMKKK